MKLVMDTRPTPNFLQAFFGSLAVIKDYPRYAERSLGSAFAHLLLVLTLVCSLLAFMASQWFNSMVGPHLLSFAAEIPHVTVSDGKAQVDIPQPHVFDIEGEPIFIIDTTQDPKVYTDDHKAIIILSLDAITVKEDSGEITTYGLSDFTGDFELSSTTAENWIKTLEAWTLPIFFFLTFLWAIILKPLQVLLVAGVVTLIHQSRPSFSTHLRLACYALTPALAWTTLAFGLSLSGVAIPGAGLVFWVILGGATWYTASLIKNTPWHQ